MNTSNVGGLCPSPFLKSGGATAPLPPFSYPSVSRPHLKHWPSLTYALRFTTHLATNHRQTQRDVDAHEMAKYHKVTTRGLTNEEAACCHCWQSRGAAPSQRGRVWYGGVVL